MNYNWPIITITILLPPFIIIIIYSLRVFHISVTVHWSLSDSKSPQVSRTLLGILAILNNAVVWTVSTRSVISTPSSPCTNPLVTVPRWMVSTRPLTSKSFSPFNNPLVTIPNPPITIGNYTNRDWSPSRSIVFSIPKQGRSTYPSFPFLSVLFCSQPRQQSPQFCKFSFSFFVDYY